AAGHAGALGVDRVADRAGVGPLRRGDEGVAESVGELRAVAEPDLPGSGRPLGQMVEVVARAVEGAELDPGQVKAARQQLPVFPLLTRQARTSKLSPGKASWKKAGEGCPVGVVRPRGHRFGHGGREVIPL